MFIATIIFSTKIGPSRETCVVSQTIFGVHDRVERIKNVLKQYKLVFIGSIIEEVSEIDFTHDALGHISEASALDFISQSGKMVH